jgi:hypothetical protein
MKELFGDSPSSDSIEFIPELTSDVVEFEPEIVFGEPLTQDILDSIQNYVTDQKYSQQTIQEYESIAKNKGVVEALKYDALITQTRYEMMKDDKHPPSL